MSSTILISSRTTFFSRSMSSALNAGPHDDVGQDVDRERQVLVEDLDVVARVFLGGERVHLAADGVDRLRDVLGAAGGGALEEHVLDEMGDAALLPRLMARTARQPHADAHRAHVRHPLGEETEPVGKHVADDRCLRHGCSIQWRSRGRPAASASVRHDARRKPLTDRELEERRIISCADVTRLARRHRAVQSNARIL